MNQTGRQSGSGEFSGGGYRGSVLQTFALGGSRAESSATAEQGGVPVYVWLVLFGGLGVFAWLAMRRKG